MSRSGYSDDCDGWALIRWRGAVNSAIRGKRGQEALREIATALDALPEKELAANSLVTADGEFCTLGALGRMRGIDMSNIDPEDREAIARTFGIAEAMAAEIMFLNDDTTADWEYVQVEVCGPLRPHHPRFRWERAPIKNAAALRWQYMRNWVSEQLKGDRNG